MLSIVTSVTNRKKCCNYIMIGRFFVHRHIIKFNDFFPAYSAIDSIVLYFEPPSVWMAIKKKRKKNRFANSTSLIAWIKINDPSLHKYKYLNCWFAHICFFLIKWLFRVVSFLNLDITKWSILHMMVSLITYLSILRT